MISQGISDPIPALERAIAVTVNLYDHIREDDEARVRCLLLLAHLRKARKDAQ